MYWKIMKNGLFYFKKIIQKMILELSEIEVISINDV